MNLDNITAYECCRAGGSIHVIVEDKTTGYTGSGFHNRSASEAYDRAVLSLEKTIEINRKRMEGNK